MRTKVFLAGATGVIGRLLVPMLLDGLCDVTGTSRSPEKAQRLGQMGVRGVAVDVLDADALAAAMQAAQPEIVIHQLTDLPFAPDHPSFAEGAARNVRLRVEGTRNLMAAAKAVGARRVIAQSIAFVYAPGPTPHREGDPLDTEGPRAASIRGVIALEEAVLGTEGIDGLVLRYGSLYGPGTWYETGPNAPPAIHVDAASHAAFLALRRGSPGIYNVAEDDGAVAIDKARREFGFDPSFRVGATS